MLARSHSIATRPQRQWAYALSLGTALLTYLVLTVRALPLPNVVALVLAISTPYLFVVTLAGLALSLSTTRRVLVVLNLFALALSLALPGSWYFTDRPRFSPETSKASELRVLASNLRMGQADAIQFVSLASAHADVIKVSELTPDAVKRLTSAGITDRFPYSLLQPEPGAAGIGIWSRYPLVSVEPAKRKNVSLVAGRIRIPGANASPLVVSLHITSPATAEVGSFGRWQSGIASAKLNLDHFAQLAGSDVVIASGDFNSTPDMRQFRDLLTEGYQDAAAQVGALWQPTFPSRHWFPPLITIDHVLTRNAHATTLNTVKVSGSDHMALLATVQLRVDSAPTEATPSARIRVKPWGAREGQSNLPRR